MNRLQLVISCFLCAGVTVNSQEIIQPNPGLSAVGILGSMGVSATLASAVMMASVQKLQIDLKVCQKLIEIQTNREIEECIREDDACNAALMECNMRLQERRDEVNSEEDIVLLEGLCLTQPNFCRCLRFDDRTECENEGCQIKTRGTRELCFPSNVQG
ncbi:uncharacterized protein [Magallana gigas]|uniref:uncharacterized protein n=1 Tax=Magallana gigas TaxID=29159 RepID=UPI00333EA03B